MFINIKFDVYDMQHMFFLTVLSGVGPADCGRRGSGRVRDAEGVHQALAAVRKTDCALLGKHFVIYIGK